MQCEEDFRPRQLQKRLNGAKERLKVNSSYSLLEHGDKDKPVEGIVRGIE
jgi:hypothetical protein